MGGPNSKIRMISTVRIRASGPIIKIISKCKLTVKALNEIADINIYENDQVKYKYQWRRVNTNVAAKYRDGADMKN